MRQTIAAILFLGLLSQIHAQGPYELSWKKEAVFLGASALLVIPMLLVDPDTYYLSEEEILSLDPQEVNGFDRGAIKNWSEQAHLLSDIGMFAPAGLAAASVPLIPAIEARDNYWKEAFTLGVIWLESNLINLGGTELVKSSVKRVRPYAYNEEVDMETKLEDADLRKSFFSGHTSISAVNSFFLAKVYADYFPESRWRPLTWSVAALIPAFTGYMRVRAGEHFPTDVMAGYGFGALVGYFVPHFHKIKISHTSTTMRLVPYTHMGATGLSVQWSF